MMGWWKRFKVWLLEDPYESPLKDWEPGKLLIFPIVRPTQAECSDAPAGASSHDSALAAIPSISDPSRNDEGSDGKSDSGSESGWFWAETVEGLPPNDVIEPLEHADVLPDSTFRVFPSATNHRNSYDDEGSVKRAMAYRKGRSQGYYFDGVWVSSPTKVYKAETVWRDVTDEFVR